MKIRIDADDRHFEYETEPMSPERFSTVCKLIKTVGGTVGLLVAVHIVGVAAIVGALVALFFYGLYKSMDF